MNCNPTHATTRNQPARHRRVAGILSKLLLPATAMCLFQPLSVSAQLLELVPVIDKGLISVTVDPGYPPDQILCGDDVKKAVAEKLSATQGLNTEEKLSAESKIYDTFSYCTQDSQATTTSQFHVAARECGATLSNVGSLYYEDMACCGYDPQRRQFACPVRIKQPFGFGGAPLPGSREYVLHCVADANGVLVPVARDSVHLANEMHGMSPSWQFAVIANANRNLHTVYPMTGETRRARSILSWGLEPTSCNYQPIWGNALNYRIRLDQ